MKQNFKAFKNKSSGYEKTIKLRRITMYRIIIILLVSFAGLFAQGRIIIPEPPISMKVPKIDLKKVDASVLIRSGVGKVTLEQTFHNESAARLEGEYLFFMPDEAHVHDFHLYINGKKTRGEVLDAKQAFEIYTNIVRKMRDPALLEYANQGMFKARIFPIEPKSDRKIELSYGQMIYHTPGTYRFTLPIRQSGQGSIDEFHIHIDLEAEGQLGDVYSPSHHIQVTRINGRKANISFEATNLEANKDFILYYTVANQDINGTLLTFRPRTDRDGYFLFLTTPRYQVREQQYIPKDVIFVVDVSGSMQGEKIEQAKNALRFCVNTLRENDRFEIISFSSTIANFKGKLDRAGKEEVENARYFIENLYASGGTNINAALMRALKLRDSNDKRPASIVFLTDGLPSCSKNLQLRCRL
jgi:Ca-activated chloride channel family protein